MIRFSCMGQTPYTDSRILPLNLGFNHMGSLCAQGEDQAASGRADTIPIAQIVSVFDVSKSEFLSQVGAR